MNDKDHGFDLDDILNEYGSGSKKEPPKAASAPVRSQSSAARPASQQAPSTAGQQPSAQAPVHPQRRPAPQPQTPTPAKRPPQTAEKAESERGMRIITIALIVIAALSLLWAFKNLHPASDNSINAVADSRLNLVNKFDVYMNNAASDALSNLAYIKKIYKIDESALAGRKPNPANFGTTTDPAVVQQVIDSASELLDGQSVAWDPNVDFYPGSVVTYYYDETILVIAWKEIINDKVCTFAEVKIADGSQLRRMLAGDSYGSDVQYYPTEMADMCNAVIALSGDFYTFRQRGITVYQRQLYRFEPKTVDSCFFTASGDMLFSYRGELSTEAEAKQFISDNDVTFAVAFGPVLVDNGELIHCDSYPIGEVNGIYSRTVIGQRDTLHYILLTVNFEEDHQMSATINETAQFIYDKGVVKAYALDGGQTSTMVMNGSTVNRPDRGNQRTMSDIIYFATALPEEVSK